MGKYKADKYISSYYTHDIYNQSLEKKAYDLGVANGMFMLYRYLKTSEGVEVADKCFKNLLDSKDEYSKILKTLIGLENEEESKIERMMNIYFEEKQNNKIQLTKNEIDLLAKFMDFLWRNK